MQAGTASISLHAVLASAVSSSPMQCCQAVLRQRQLIGTPCMSAQSLLGHATTQPGCFAERSAQQAGSRGSGSAAPGPACPAGPRSPADEASRESRSPSTANAAPCLAAQPSASTGNGSPDEVVLDWGYRHAQPQPRPRLQQASVATRADSPCQPHAVAGSSDVMEALDQRSAPTCVSLIISGQLRQGRASTDVQQEPAGPSNATCPGII